LTKDRLSGYVQFSKVHFSYPSRPDVPVLTGLSFNAKPGQTIAIVGSSGSGKSTCVQLLQRFYDYQSGSIILDGKKIHQYNLKWLRQQIGVVSQEPNLFQTTIRENILFGCDSATDKAMYKAAKMANAHDFIMSLPDVRKILI
jgi:ABC-type multidrug transport system fused ATPase/permease subunit